MPYKWDENSTFVFLNAYRKHPCLWNPYDVKYYNCLTKNEALINIIKELNISKLNISDCLEQIRVIREKYRQEQIRTIQGLQSQRPYKSPFAWFPVIAGMLTKVINDEGKLQKGIKSVEPISHSIFKDCVTTSHGKYLDASNFPCAHGEVKGQNFKKPQETKQDYKTRRRKNTKFTKTGYVLEDPDKSDGKGKEKYDMRLDLLLCPSCGWEDTRPDESSIVVPDKKTYESTCLLDTVPCPEYLNLVDKPYEEYNLYQHPVANGQGRYNNTVPCPSYPRNLSSYFRYPANILTTHRSRDIRDYASQQRKQEAIVASKPKICTRETQLSSEQLFPERRTKQVGTSVAHCNKEIQNTICVSRTNVALPTSKCAIKLQTSNHAEEIDARRKCHRKVQSELLTSRGEKLKQIAINTVEQCDKKIQNTICVSRVNSSDCQALDNYSLTRELKQIDADIVECPAKDMQNIISIKILHKSIDGNYVPLIETDFKLKRLETDKCQKDDSYENQGEAERDQCALDGKKVENNVCCKETCSRDIIKIIKHNSVVTRALLQCLEKGIQEEAKMHSLKRNDVKSSSSEGTICEPCKLETTNFATSSATELEDPDCLPCLEEMEKNNAAATYTETFFEVLKHILALNIKKYAKNVREGCVRKEDAFDTFTVLNVIKKCAEKILEIYTIEDCLKKRLSKRFCPRYKSKGKCPPKADMTLSPIQTRASENDVDVEILYEPSALETNKEHNHSENYTTLAEARAEERLVRDEGTIARTDNRDVGLDVSLSQVSLRDSETQYISKQLQDTGVVTEHRKSFEEKENIGTQIHEPALIRVIKCTDEILKIDKETCVRDVRAAWMRRAIDECTETCPALQRLSENVYRKYILRKRYNERSLPGINVSHVREKEVNRIDYRNSPLPNRNYKSDKECRSASSYNRGWRKINTSTLELLSNRRVSKIPLYARSHKYTNRINFYKISQSYM